MATVTTIIFYVLAAIGTVATTASAIAPMIEPASKLGQWVAWIASCPAGHSPRVVETKALPPKDSK